MSLTATAVEAHPVAETAFRSNRKLVTSYMLRHHPSWVEFIRQTRQLGPPFMTMSPSRPSAGYPQTHTAGRKYTQYSLRSQHVHQIVVGHVVRRQL